MPNSVFQKSLFCPLSTSFSFTFALLKGQNSLPASLWEVSFTSHEKAFSLVLWPLNSVELAKNNWRYGFCPSEWMYKISFWKWFATWLNDVPLSTLADFSLYIECKFKFFLRENGLIRRVVALAFTAVPESWCYPLRDCCVFVSVLLYQLCAPDDVLFRVCHFVDIIRLAPASLQNL